MEGVAANTEPRSTSHCLQTATAQAFILTHKQPIKVP